MDGVSLGTGAGAVLVQETGRKGMLGRMCQDGRPSREDGNPTALQKMSRAASNHHLQL